MRWQQRWICWTERLVILDGKPQPVISHPFTLAKNHDPHAGGIWQWVCFSDAAQHFKQKIQRTTIHASRKIKLCTLSMHTCKLFWLSKNPDFSHFRMHIVSTTRILLWSIKTYHKVRLQSLHLSTKKKSACQTYQKTYCCFFFFPFKKKSMSALS